MKIYRGVKFFQGVCILMNTALVSELAQHHVAPTRINYNVVDDVEIGRFIWTLNPDELYTKDISDRMHSYYMGNPMNPYIFCNNRYKANRRSDLDCFRSVAEMHTTKL